MARLINDIEVLSDSGVLLDDVRSCSRYFNQLRYSHVKREGNMAAHGLARYDVHILDFIVCMKDVPPQFFPVIQADLAGVS